MRQECVDSISQTLGRQFTSEEGDELIKNLRIKMGVLKKSDEFKDKWAGMSQDEKTLAAGQALAEDMKAKTERRKSLIYKTIIIQDKVTRRLDFLAKDQDIHAYAGVAKVLQETYQVARGIQNEYLSMMLDTLNGIRSKWLGFMENAEDSMAFVKEVYGEDTGNAAAKQAAQAWLKTIESMRQRAVDAGADIGKLNYGYVPQSHDWVKVRKAGMSAWISEVLPKLDRDRYLDANGNRMTDQQIVEQYLEPAWRDIVTSGNVTDDIFEIKNDLMIGSPNGIKPVPGSSEHRVLHFKDAQSFMEYEGKFGEGSVTDALIRHVSKLSNDIAIIEQLGPQPHATFEMMKYIAQSEALNARMTENQFRLLKDFSNAMGITGVNIDQMWDVLLGKTSVAAPNREGFARFMSGVRNFEIMGKLGKAFITSLSDIPTYFITTGFHNLDFFQSVRFLKNAYGREWKDYANRMGFIADSIASEFCRWGNDNIGQGWTSKLANATMRASFLQGFTDATRRAFCLNMCAGIGKLIDTPWEKLSKYDRARLEDGGITERDWRIMQEAGTEEYKGVKFFSLSKLKSLIENEGLVALYGKQDIVAAPSKVIGFIVKESEMASMNPDLITRAETNRGSQRGTIGGEFMRCIALFKSFPLTMMEQHYRRAMFLARNEGNAAAVKYAASIALATTIFGAISLQIQNVLNGKDLQDVTDKSFWLNAMAKGGGLGFLGDYLAYGLSEDSAYGAMSGVTNFAGPVASTIVGTSDVITSAVGNAIYDKNTKTGAKATRLLRQHMPFVNLWYASTVIDRAFMDELQDYLSPGYSRAKESRLRRGTGQGYWWAPGELAPDRGVKMAEKPRR